MTQPLPPWAERARRKRAVETALDEGLPPPGQAAPSRGRAAVRTAAQRLDVSPATLYTWLRLEERESAARHRHCLPDWRRYRPPAARTATAADEAAALRRDLARAKVDLTRLEKEVRAANDMRRQFGLAQAAPLAVPAWTRARSKPGSPGTPVLFASDEQWGETVEARALDGINAYNSTIAAARKTKFFAAALDLCFNHTANPCYRGIVYLRGGDSVSGDIHEELQRTNDAEPLPALRDFAAHEIAGIRALAEQFAEVHVVSVPGNHGRTHRKPYAKRYVETNYDYMATCLVEREFKLLAERGNATEKALARRVRFTSPVSGDARFQVEGFRCLLTHGDRMGSRGGMGFIGPAATIARGHQRLIQYFSRLRENVDYVFTGHMHTSLVLEFGIANGSPVGVSEYARDGRMTPHPPQQTLCFFHHHYGIIDWRPIYLAERPRLK